MHNQAEDAFTAANSEPTATIPRYALREALKNAEYAADEILTKLRGLQAQRDDHVRMAGEAQAGIDQLQTELNRRTRHVRTLAVAAASAESKA